MAVEARITSMIPCDGVEAYAYHVRAAHDGAVGVPVIVSADQPTDSVPMSRPHGIRSLSRHETAELIRSFDGGAADAATALRNENAVVVVGNDQAARLAALMFAEARGRRLLRVAGWDGLTALIGRAEDASLSVVANLGEYPDAMKVVLGLSGLAVDRGVSFGLLVGRDAAQLTWMVAKALLPPTAPGGRHVLLFPQRTSGFHEGARRTVVVGRGVRTYLDESLDAAPVAFLAIDSSGRPDFIDLGSKVICGRRRSGPAAASAPRPSCGYGAGCVRPGRPIPAFALRADTILFDACQSGHLGASIYGQDYLLTISALDGTAMNVVGTLRAMSNAGWETELFDALLRDGVDHGNAVRLLNAATAEFHGEEPAYVLFGDPMARVSSGGGDPSSGRDPGGRSAALLAAADVTGEGLPRVAHAGVSGFAPLRTSTGRGLVVWSDSEAGLGERADAAEISAARAAREVAARWERVGANLTTGALHGIAPHLETGDVARTQRLARALDRRLSRAVSRPDGTEQIAQAAAKLRARLDWIDEELLRRLTGDGERLPFPFHQNHDDLFRPAGDPVRDGWCWCGAHLVGCDLRSGGGMVTRVKKSCFRCGLIALCASDALPVRWTGPSKTRRSGAVEHLFEIGPTDRQVSGAVGLAFPWARAGNVELSPRYGRFELTPGKATTLSLATLLDGLQPNIYCVRAYVVYDGNIDHYRRAVEVAGNEI